MFSLLRTNNKGIRNINAENPRLNFGNETTYISEERNISEIFSNISLVLPFEISFSPSFPVLISLYLQS